MPTPVAAARKKTAWVLVAGVTALILVGTVAFAMTRKGNEGAVPCAVKAPGLPQLHFALPGTLSGGSNATVPEVTDWASSPTPGVSYEAQRRVDNGEWTDVTMDQSGSAVESDLALGSIYDFRVRARAAGCASAWSSKNAFRVLGYQQYSGEDSGSWAFVQSPGYWDGNAKHTTQRGASITFSFVGRNVAMIGTAGPGMGGFREYIDGKLVDTPSAQASETTHRSVLTRFGWATSGRHTLKIVNLGSAGHAGLTVDGFVVFE